MPMLNISLLPFVLAYVLNQFDFDAMTKEVSEYEKKMLAGQVLASLVDGSHAYYKYLNDLVLLSRMKGNPLKDNLYRSLEPLLSHFACEWQSFEIKFTPTPLFDWVTALSSSFMDFPDEIKMAILNVLPHSDLLALRPVNRRLWELVTPITHSRLCFLLGLATSKPN
ncbi:hypothetical protein IW261DRAFT_1566574 [Armillaria novae-zelandiae]|uniref:F-box domain-containing protein n=1 Tax=Armillaria novae-zelandiae TaxID=153914 RepID=A0AA39U8M9_9AGAR|nr:hypothetical protein IW261DRAFT_1566574 [Armillaria novae-zelandiae]